MKFKNLFLEISQFILFLTFPFSFKSSLTMSFDLKFTENYCHYFHNSRKSCKPKTSLLLNEVEWQKSRIKSTTETFPRKSFAMKELHLINSIKNETSAILLSINSSSSTESEAQNKSTFMFYKFHSILLHPSRCIEWNFLLSTRNMKKNFVFHSTSENSGKLTIAFSQMIFYSLFCCRTVKKIYLVHKKFKTFEF